MEPYQGTDDEFWLNFWILSINSKAEPAYYKVMMKELTG